MSRPAPTTGAKGARDAADCIGCRTPLLGRTLYPLEGAPPPPQPYVDPEEWLEDVALEEAPGDGWPRADAYMVEVVMQSAETPGPVPYLGAQASVQDAGTLGDDSPIKQLAAHQDLSTVVKMEAALPAEVEAMYLPGTVNTPLMPDTSRLEHAIDGSSKRLEGTQDSDLAAPFARPYPPSTRQKSRLWDEINPTEILLPRDAGRGHADFKVAIEKEYKGLLDQQVLEKVCIARNRRAILNVLR